MTVSECGERRLLARIRARLATTGRPPADVVIGIGDDAAVVRPSRNAQTVLTTDAQVEGVHFDRRYSSAADIGFRALAVNLSDLAAMGARPRWALLSLVLPDAMAVDDVEEVVGGVGEAGAAAGAVIVGGNLARSPGPLIVDITAVGEVQPRRLLTRSGGRPGDELFVSGTIGAAAAGLEMLGAGADEAAASAACMTAYRRPAARGRLGVAIGRARAASAAMDLSDGLGAAAHQLAEASGCGVEIEAERLPVHDDARRWWVARGVDPVRAALAGGDDYELLLAVPRAWSGRLRHATGRVSEPRLTKIGVLTKDPGSRVLHVERRRETLPGGFEHWKTREGAGST